MQPLLCLKLPSISRGRAGTTCWCHYLLPKVPAKEMFLLSAKEPALPFLLQLRAGAVWADKTRKEQWFLPPPLQFSSSDSQSQRLQIGRWQFYICLEGKLHFKSQVNPLDNSTWLSEQEPGDSNREGRLMRKLAEHHSSPPPGPVLCSEQFLPIYF